jgi:hypothetical protein
LTNDTTLPMDGRSALFSRWFRNHLFTCILWQNVCATKFV